MIPNIFNLIFPNWKLQRRSDYSRWRGYAFKLLAVVLALLITAAALKASGKSPLELARTLITTSLTTEFGRKQLLRLATPLIFNGAAFLIASRMQLFNLGLEGQLYIGGFAAVAVGLFVSGPPAVIILLMLLSAMVAGALYSLIPAAMRIKAGVSEILTTLLLNPLAIQFASYIGIDVWRDRSAVGGSANTTGFTVQRKPEGGASWGNVIASLPSTATQYVDNSVQVGVSYEYRIVRNTSNLGQGFAYINAGIELPMVEHRGTLVLLVDNTFTSSLAAPLAQLQEDLEGDGWKVVRFWNDDVLNDVDTVCGHILRVIGRDGQ